jgi:hypothetical protein
MATLNQRLDQMGPRYRAVYGKLYRVLAILEDASRSEPPYLEPSRLESIRGMVAQTAAELGGSSERIKERRENDRTPTEAVSETECQQAFREAMNNLFRDEMSRRGDLGDATVEFVSFLTRLIAYRFAMIPGADEILINTLRAAFKVAKSARELDQALNQRKP